MSEFYQLSDPDNRDADGNPWVIRVHTLSELAGYVDGVLREDVLPGAREHVDVAVQALHREHFPTAQSALLQVGCYLSIEWSEDDEF